MPRDGAWDHDKDIQAVRLLVSETPANKTLTLGLKFRYWLGKLGKNRGLGCWECYQTSRMQLSQWLNKKDNCFQEKAKAHLPGQSQNWNW